MEKHIDVMGFLLSALVFSVGFLSAREHSQYEAIATQVRERAWHLTEILTEGKRLVPEDLLLELAVIRPSRDRVALFSRCVNLLIFVFIALVYGDAVRLAHLLEGVPHDATLITTCLFGSAIFVTGLGEYDSQRVAVDERELVSRSVLGQFEALRQLVDDGDLPTARDRLATLIEQYPQSNLLNELAALLTLQSGDVSAAWERATQTVAQAEVHFSPMLLGEAAVTLQREDDARQLLQDLNARARVASAQLLETSLALRTLQPETVFNQLPAGVLDAAERATRDSASIGLDVRLGELAGVRELVGDLIAWHAPGTDADTTLRGPTLVALLGELGRRGRDELLLDTEDFRSPALITLGLVCLAQDRSRGALRLFERAVRLTPASAIAHWGRAIACRQLAWTDAAFDSLRRAETLGLPETLLAATRNLLANDPESLSENDLLVEGTATDLERLMLALAGVTTQSVQNDSRRARLLENLTHRDTAFSRSA
jgi:tetratricopeptide (TPR) repeat protein